MRRILDWSPELNALVRGVELLPSLLARRAPSGKAHWLSVVNSLTPEQVGLRSVTREQRDWELICGGLFYAGDALDRAHSIFQEVDTPEGAYWHGMLHRREGDFSNSRYWIQRAGRVAALAGLDALSPVLFIGKCEAAAKKQEDPGGLLELQRQEWDAMMRWSWSRLMEGVGGANGG